MILRGFRQIKKMPRAGIEPATRGFSVLCSTNWAIWALSSGDRIWTYDLRVMSPTSFQTAPSRAMKLLLIIFVIKRMGRGGFEPPKQFAADLQSVPFGNSGIPPYLSLEPMIGLEPITCWLQISCSANWATSAYIFISWFVISCSACDQLTSFVDLSELSHIGVYYIYLSDYSDKRTLFWESFSVTPTGIEPVLPPWKGDVLTAWPRSLIFFSLRLIAVFFPGFSSR